MSQYKLISIEGPYVEKEGGWIKLGKGCKVTLEEASDSEKFELLPQRKERALKFEIHPKALEHARRVAARRASLQ